LELFGENTIFGSVTEIGVILLIMRDCPNPMTIEDCLSNGGKPCALSTVANVRQRTAILYAVSVLAK